MPDCGHRCSTCRRETNFVPGEGPLPCSLAFVGEGPGYWEDVRRRPFVGETGKEVSGTYLPLAGIEDRGEVYLTNTIKCRTPNNRDPSRKEIEACSAAFLQDELYECRPEIVVLMGGIACSITDGIDLETHHGRLLKKRIFNRDYWVYPTFHPAAGLRGMTIGGGDNENVGPVPVMELLLEDFAQLREVAGGEWEAPEDEYGDPVFKLLENVEDVRMAVDRTIPHIAVDCETERGELWSIQWCQELGYAWMILASRKDLVSAFREMVGGATDLTFVFHNAPGDLDELDKFGIIPVQYEDTMQMAYRLQNLPQSLKRLAYRLASVGMKTYEDLVGPPWRDAVMQYLTEIYLKVPQVEEHYITPKKKLKRVRYKPHPIESILRRIIKHTGMNREYDPVSRWEGIEEGVRDELVELAGGRMLPEKVISIAPMEEVVDYASRDAHETLRAWFELRRMTEEFGNWVREGDTDR